MLIMSWFQKITSIASGPLINEKQNIAIAELYGWKRVQVIGYPSHAKEYDTIAQLPYYTSDLNAMREAQKGLTDDQRNEYVGWLARMNKVKHFNI